MSRFRPGTVVLATALVIAGACGRTDQAPQNDTSAAVSIEAARTETLREVVNVPGTVVISMLGELLVIPPGPAIVTEVPKKEGDVVAVGDVLARFDVTGLTQEFQTRQLEHTEAANRVTRARDTVKQQTALYERGLTPRNTLEEAKADLATTEFAMTQADLHLATAKASLAGAVIVAGFPGLVGSVLHVPGEFVSGLLNDPVMRVIDPTKVQVLVQVPIVQLGKVAQGQTATVAPLGPGTAETATVISKSPAAANAPTAEVRLALTGATALTLNAPVSVEILIDQRTGAVVVPATAMQKDEAGTFVIVVGADLLAHRRDVRVGLTARDLTQITEGLSAGDRVVTSGLQGLTDGAAVTIVK
jgi:RND family efflux transporter MFP subunit